MNKEFIKNKIIDTLSSKQISYLAMKAIGRGVPIFMLHRTFPDSMHDKDQTPSYLKRCLHYLRENKYHFLSVDEIFETLQNGEKLPNKAVAFTIDDGFDDQASLAAPVFIENDCPVTIFLVTGFINGELWPWFSQVEHLIQNSLQPSISLNLNETIYTYSLNTEKEKSRASQQILEIFKTSLWQNIPQLIQHLSEQTKVNLPDSPPDNARALTWDAARELETDIVSFGAHTHTHPILSKTDDSQAAYEINHSWQIINEQLQNPSKIFCYPNGQPNDYGNREIELLKNSEMLGALSTTPKQFETTDISEDEYYRVPRYSLPGNFHNFKMYVSWIEYAKEKLRR